MDKISSFSTWYEYWDFLCKIMPNLYDVYRQKELELINIDTQALARDQPVFIIDRLIGAACFSTITIHYSVVSWEA